MRFGRIAVFICVVIALTPSAFAWNKAGHMVTGAMAYYDLQSTHDTNVIAQVVATLKKHPWYRSWISDLKLPTGAGMANHDLVLFMNAARWPDDIRGIPRFHCGECHYINYPYKPPGTPESVQVRPPRSTNVVSTLGWKRAVLRSSASTRDQAVALSWVYHLVGDIHTPLHSTALFSEGFPEGDHGGNLIFVKTAPGPLAENLHAWWDGCVIQDEHWRIAKLRAIQLLANPALRRSELSELGDSHNFKAWSKESNELAKSAVYLYGELPMGKSWLDAKIMSATYMANARKISERRITLAGYRLADLLRETYGGDKVLAGKKAVEAN